jgi:Carboxypeptidase regulatory-like domain
MRKSALWGSLLAVVCAGAMSFAQQTSGSISGVVKDASGAVVAGAQVKITNEGTQSTRSVATDSVGFFTAPVLPVGTYTITVSMSGFQTAVLKDVDLHVNDTKTVSISLQLGAVTQSVEVIGGGSQVQLRSSEISNLITGQQTTELPLNGRSFVQLTLLVPGASVANGANMRNTGLLSSVDISVSGSPSNSNMWLVDGANNVDIGSGRTILVYPSVDSIAEFKIERNSYGPEMGASGGAQINLVTKSGTNAFHGSGYEFLRNDALNGVNYFLNSVPRNADGTRASPVGKLRYNDFGYTVGGPIVKDKAFFFWSEEWRHEKRGITRQSLVPSPAERVGDFSGVLNPRSGGVPVDPYTGLPFPGNDMRNDPSKLSPAGLAIMDLYPMPTFFDNGPNPGWRWLQPVTTPIQTRQEQIRVDYNITPTMSLMGRYTQDYWVNNAPNYGSEGGLWGDTGFPTVDSNWDQPSKSLAIQLTNTIGPSMVNQIQFSYSNNRIIVTPGIGQDINTKINDAIPVGFANKSPDRPHSIFWGSPIGPDLWNQFPWTNGQDLYVWKDDFSFVKGNHSLKVGGLFSRNKKDEDIDNQISPQFWGPSAVPGTGGVNATSGGGWGPSTAPGNGDVVTGNNIADLLLKGSFWGADERDATPRARTRWRDYEFYGRDTWRATPRLTFDLGVRWSYLPNAFDAMDLMGNFVPELYDPSLGSLFSNGMIFPTGYVNPDRGITGGSANLKGLNVNGASLVHNHWDDFSPRAGFAWDPTGSGKWAIRVGGGMFHNREAISDVLALGGNPPFSAIAHWPDGRALDVLDVASAPEVGSPTRGKDLASKTPGSYQWHFTIERQVGSSTKVEVSYVGNRGHHLPLTLNLNQVPSPQRAQYVQCQLDIGDQTPCGGSGDGTNLRNLAPLEGSQELQWYQRGGNSSYHAFQVYLVKRFSHNFSYQVSYSLSKVLGTSNLGYLTDQYLTDSENAKYDRGLANFDRTHILTINGIYRLPALANHNWAARGVLGNWELASIYSYSTGNPITINMSGGGIGTQSVRPDQVGTPQLANPPDKTVWLDANAFALPVEMGRLGYSTKNQARNPPINNWDMAFYKNFPLRFREGMSIQFRGEFFNFLNHTQFLDPDTNWQVDQLDGNAATGKYTSCGAGASFPQCNINTEFGRITRARDGREIQFAVKILF